MTCNNSDKCCKCFKTKCKGAAKHSGGSSGYTVVRPGVGMVGSDDGGYSQPMVQSSHPAVIAAQMRAQSAGHSTHQEPEPVMQTAYVPPAINYSQATTAPPPMAFFPDMSLVDGALLLAPSLRSREQKQAADAALLPLHQQCGRLLPLPEPVLAPPPPPPMMHTPVPQSQGPMKLTSWMSKSGGSITTWHRRYFVMREGDHDIKYYETSHEGTPKGIIPFKEIVEARITESGERFHTWEIVTAARVYKISAETKDDQEMWVQAVNVIKNPDPEAARSLAAAYHARKQQQGGGILKSVGGVVAGIAGSEAQEKCVIM